MSMTDLRDEIDRSFGTGPALAPVEQRIAAGRRALVRRRIGGGVAALAAVAVVGTGVYAVAPGDPVGRGTGHVAVDPSPTPTPTPTPTPSPSGQPGGPWEDDIPVRYIDGELQVRDGVVVHERIKNPYGYAPPRTSDALDLTYQGERMWVIVDLGRNGYGLSSSSPSNGWASFADYVADQVDGQTGGEDGWPDTMELTADGRVVPTAGTTVHNRTDDPQLGPDFAPAGATTGAAVVTVAGDPHSYFLVWRVIDGQLDVLTTPPNEVTGATFDELLSYARAQYASGEGLR